MASRLLISISSDEAPDRTFEDAIEKILKPSGIKVGGFPEDIFINFGERDDLFCNICFLIINNCYECDNQHKFCRACVLAWSLTSRENCNKCPMCRCPQPDYHAVPEIDEELNLKTVKCPELDCNFTATLSVFLQHCHGRSLFNNQDVNFALIEKERLSPRPNDTMSRLLERFSEDSFGINGLFVIRQHELSLRMMRMRLDLMRLVTASQSLDINTPIRRTDVQVHASEHIVPQLDQVSNIVNEIDVFDTYIERFFNLVEFEPEAAINDSNNAEANGGAMYSDHDYALSELEYAAQQNTDVDDMDNLDEIDVPLTRSQFMSRVLNSNIQNIESPQILTDTNTSSESTSSSSLSILSTSSSNLSLLDYAGKQQLNITDWTNQFSDLNNEKPQTIKNPEYSYVCDEPNISDDNNQLCEVNFHAINSQAIKDPDYSFICNAVERKSVFDNDVNSYLSNLENHHSTNCFPVERHLVYDNNDNLYLSNLENNNSTNCLPNNYIINYKKENSETSSLSKIFCEHQIWREEDLSDVSQPKNYTEMDDFQIQPFECKIHNSGSIAEAGYLKLSTSNTSVGRPGSSQNKYEKNQLISNSIYENHYNIISSQRNSLQLIETDSSNRAIEDENFEDIFNLEQIGIQNKFDKKKLASNNLLQVTSASSEMGCFKLPSIVNDVSLSLRNDLEISNNNLLFNNNDIFLDFISDPQKSSNSSEISKIPEDNWQTSNFSQNNNEILKEINSNSTDIDLKTLQQSCSIQPKKKKVPTATLR